MYSTNPLIVHLGSACAPMSTVFLMSVGFGCSSKLPFSRYPEAEQVTDQTLHQRNYVKLKIKNKKMPSSGDRICIVV